MRSLEEPPSSANSTKKHPEPSLSASTVPTFPACAGRVCFTRTRSPGAAASGVAEAAAVSACDGTAAACRIASACACREATASAVPATAVPSGFWTCVGLNTSTVTESEGSCIRTRSDPSPRSGTSTTPTFPLWCGGARMITWSPTFMPPSPLTPTLSTEASTDEAFAGSMSVRYDGASSSMSWQSTNFTRIIGCLSSAETTVHNRPS
mmetsp:Transcript_64406/g.153768  ORF Transcript_64406/g.153768 Transcript_64406/m.153768 type:complete len:208 (-) Transcript_64406:519-1142(-)